MKVSVIIPTHNRANLLTNALDSVLEQTYQDYEIIVVSDGSTDNTEEVVKGYQDRDSRIKLIQYYPSVNGSHARNIGIKEASGEYIAFLDDDDTWYSEKLQKQVSILDNNTEVGLVTAGIYYNYVNEKIIYESIPRATGDLSRKILLFNCVGGTQAIVRKSILERSGVFDEALKALQDYDLWIRVCQFTKVATLEEPCITYNNYRGGKQVSQITKNYEESFKHINKKYSSYIEKLSLRERKIRTSNAYLLIANKAMRNDDKKTAYKYIIKALRLKVSKKGMAYAMMAMFKYDVVLKARKKFRV